MDGSEFIASWNDQRIPSLFAASFGPVNSPRRFVIDGSFLTGTLSN
jgi:hypothetical protein